MTIDTRTAIALVVSKATTLGFHTGMYDLRNLSAEAGKRVVFTWDWDGQGEAAGYTSTVTGALAVLLQETLDGLVPRLSAG